MCTPVPVLLNGRNGLTSTIHKIIFQHCCYVSIPRWDVLIVLRWQYNVKSFFHWEFTSAHKCKPVYYLVVCSNSWMVFKHEFCFRWFLCVQWNLWITTERVLLIHMQKNGECQTYDNVLLNVSLNHILGDMEPISLQLSAICLLKLSLLVYPLFPPSPLSLLPLQSTLVLVSTDKKYFQMFHSIDIWLPAVREVAFHLQSLNDVASWV